MKIVVATHNEGKLPEIRTILEGELGGAATGVELVSAGSLNLPDPVETGVTFEQNALLKARDVARRTGLPALADDSGLIVDVLGAAPGILSARWSGVHGDDKANLDLLLAQLEDIPDGKRGARFCCAAALVVPKNCIAREFDGSVPTAQETVGLGEMRGVIIREPRGENGFGYDPIFVPDDQPKRASTAEVDERIDRGDRSGRGDRGDRGDRSGGESRVESNEGYNVGSAQTNRPLTSAEMSASEKNSISHRHKAFAALAPAVKALFV